MHERFNRLFHTALIAFIVVLAVGCTQPDDIIAPVSETMLILTPDRLPTLPDSMVYYFWVLDSTDNAYYIGNFIWNNEYYQFYDLDSNAIDSVWQVDYDVLDPFYRYLCVTVEHLDDLPGGTTLPVDSIGPIMLQDTLIDPEASLMEMVFPIDIWLGDGFFCVETPSDSDSWSNEASGIWFCEYTFDYIQVSDTTDVICSFPIGTGVTPRDLVIDVFTADTGFYDCNIWDPIYPGVCNDSTEVIDTTLGYDFMAVDTLDADTFTVVYIEGVPDTVDVSVLGGTLDTVAVTHVEAIVDSQYTLLDTLVLDTFIHTYIDFDVIAPAVNITSDTLYDTVTISRYDDMAEIWVDEDTVIIIPPFVSFNHDFVYTVSSESVYVDKFLSSFEECPDLNGTKWHYKGWVMSPFLVPTTTFGTFIKPSWLDFYVQQEFTLSFAMISTGSFKSFWAADDANPYSGNKRVPKIPGEDFLFNLPAGIDSIFFVTPLTGPTAYGDVIVTLEPDNYNENQMNFPLIMMSGALPSWGFVSDSLEHVQNSTGGNANFRLRNWASTVAGNPTGFPAVHVGVARR